MSAIEVKVPDIGDFTDVPVIEVLVKPGDTVALEQSLITVESDKASMEIPSSAAGVVQDVRVAVGDKVSEGSLILRLEGADAGADAGVRRRGSGSAARGRGFNQPVSICAGTANRRAGHCAAPERGRRSSGRAARTGHR